MPDAVHTSPNPVLLARLAALDRELGDRRLVEEELRAQGDQLRYAMSAADMAVWRVDFDEQGSATWAPLPAGQAAGLPLLFVQDGLHNVHDDDRSRLLEHLERSRSTGNDFAQEIRSRPVDGRCRWLEVRARMLKDDAGRVSGALGVSIDITERKLLEEQFRRAQKLEAVGLLAGGLAHDFNNVLTAVLGYTNLLARSLDGDDPRRNDVDQIVQAAERAAALTRRLLSLSRHQVVQPVVLDVSTFVKGVSALVTGLMSARIEVVADPLATQATVRIDPSQFEQVLFNLTVNARDAMPEGGRLTIATDFIDIDEATASAAPGGHAGRFVRLRVSDNGTGMTAETRQRLFEPFFTTKERGKGTGLGLATVYGIVKQADGFIEVQSEPGAGSTFAVYLPHVSATPLSLGRRVARSARRGTETVLVVEDERAVRFLTRTVLEQAGYCVIEAVNAQEAEAVLRSGAQRIDVMITDVILPGETGPDCVRRLAGSFPALKVLFMSGYADDALTESGVLKAGAAFLQKPFTAEALAERVRQVLDG